MPNRDRPSVEDMLRAARKVLDYARGTTRETLPSVPMRLDAVLYEIVVSPCIRLSRLATAPVSFTVGRDELVREHTTLAAVDRRGARTHPLGTHPPAGGPVNGVRARTR